MTNEVQESSSWWGNFNLEADESRLWSIGPLRFSVCCLNNEWQVAYDHTSVMTEDEVSWEITDTDKLTETLSNNARYVFGKSTGLLTITPRLADRPVISRPITPFSLIGDEETTLYVSTPLWVELSVGNNQKLLTEFPIQRPSDTWFGPSTREGELCYASTTHCRLNLAELPQRSHRAITPLVIRNMAKTPLLIERLKVTTPLLPLFVSSDNQLWTPKVTLIRKQDGEMAELKIEKVPPQDANEAFQLSKPRTTQSSGTFIRAFNTVFR